MHILAPFQIFKYVHNTRQKTARLKAKVFKVFRPLKM